MLGDSSDRFEDVVNRRNFMALAGATGTAMLAGCDGDGDDGTDEETTDGMDTTDETDTTDDTNGGQDVYDETVESVAAQPMDILDWNSQYAGYPNIWGRWLVYERYAQYNLSENEWIPQLITDWSIDGNTVTINIRDPHNYADGDPVTAEDVKVHTVCNLASGAAFADVFESFNEVDEKTLEIETNEEVNKEILEFTVLSQLQQAKAAEPYDEFYQRYWEEDEDEDSVGADIQGREPDEPDYVSGVFEFQEQDSEQYVLSRNDEHPDADNINFERYRFPTYEGNQNKWEAMLGNDVDTVMSIFTPSNIQIQLDDHWQEYNFPGNWGVGLMPQHDEDVAPHISKREVRQAIAHAIDREDVVEAAGPRVKTAFPTPAAISAEVQEEYIDVGDQFDEMQGGEEKVVEIMQDAGYERNDDDVWEMDGEEVSFEVAVPSNWSDWVTATQAIVSQLTNVGFSARMNRVSDIVTTVQEGEFKLATRPWSPGNARSSFPYFPLQWVFGRADSNAHNYPGWDEDNTIEVPEMDGSGTMEVNLRERLEDLSVARGDDVESIVQELAWVSHQDLPMIPLTDKREQSFISTRNLTAPEKDDPEGNVKWPCFHAPRKGKMQWKGE